LFLPANRIGFLDYRWRRAPELNGEETRVMNTNNEETFYQAMRRKGVSRRSFLKYCSLAATSLGLGAGMTPRIAWALENKPRIPVVWIHGLECTCCTESFIRSSHPLAKDVILSDFP
jgi:hydrogenase small subunit